MTSFFVGTLTREGGEGILRCAVNGNKIEKLDVYREIIDPNYVILSRDKTRLFAVSNDFSDLEFKGAVCEFSVENDGLKLLSRVETAGNAPCFPQLSADERFLYAANYGTGSLAVFPVEGGLKNQIQLIVHEGHGPHPVRQERPHVHQVTFFPKTDLLVACDLGTDELVFYLADSETGLLTKKNALKLHGGPRHVAYAPDGTMYLAHELSNEVTVIRRKEDTFEAGATWSTLPNGWTEKNTAAAIRISGDGKQVLVSNRGHGSLAVFDILPDGNLHFNRFIMGSIFTRDFVFLPDGRIMMADQKAGVRLLAQTGEELDFLPEMGAVCICLS